MISFIKKHTYPLSIACVVLLLAALNYTQGAFLTGWDNLQTDLSPWLGVKRAWYSAWQEYQSFGLMAGMAHAADLGRALFVSFLSLFIQKSDVRFVFHFSMILIGGLGMYKLLTLSVKKYFAVAGALFYLLNIGSIQILFLPFEAFTIFFAFLPWELWTYLRIMESEESPSKKLWVQFACINVLAISQAVAQQLFVVYGLVLFIITLPFIFKNKLKFKRAAVAATIIFALNCFWILPQAYFLRTSGDVVKTAKSNQLSTEDIIYSNRETSTLTNYTSLIGFFYDRRGIYQENLFEAWRKHRESSSIFLLIYLFAAIPFIGLLKKSKFRLQFALLYPLTAIALLPELAPFSYINSVLRNNDLVNQVFRSPFTKFIIVHSLVSGFFFAHGLSLIYEKSVKRLAVDMSRLVFKVCVIVLLFMYALPAFQGQYISPAMRVKIPQEYLEIMDYFKEVDKNKRIALLPEYTFWGWFYNSWGYNGSGFIWYGIEQPIVSRTFDVWSTQSEGYFWEMKRALESEDVRIVDQILEKYAIDYLLLDYSLLPVSSTPHSLQYDRLDLILRQSSLVQPLLIGTHTRVYQVNRRNSSHAFLNLYQDLPQTSPEVALTNEDRAYVRFGTYTSVQKGAEAYYPFLNVFSQTRFMDPAWKLEEADGVFKLTSEYKSDLTEVANQQGGLPISTQFTAELFTDNQPKNLEGNVHFDADEGVINAIIDKIPVFSAKGKDLVFSPCNELEGSDVRFENGNETESIVMHSQNKSIGCLSAHVPYLDQSYGYVVEIKSKNIQGRRLYLSVTDSTKDQPYIEDRLVSDHEYFLIPPRYKYGLGYTISLLNNSYSGINSENSVPEVNVYLFPYDEVKGFYIGNEQPGSYLGHPEDAKKHNYYLYSMKPGASTDQLTTLVLNQAYHTGWTAYATQGNRFLERHLPFVFGAKLEKHVVVNNWANGWELSVDGNKIKDNSSIILLFWPQYLQYLGFFVAVLTVGKILQMKRQVKQEDPNLEMQL